MYVWVHVCMYVCVYVCMYVSVCPPVIVCAPACPFGYASVSAGRFVCMSTRMHVRVHVCMYV